jgi:hypothetical protein
MGISHFRERARSRSFDHFVGKAGLEFDPPARFVECVTYAVCDALFSARR